MVFGRGQFNQSLLCVFNTQKRYPIAFCLWRAPQPVSNTNQTPTTKHNRLPCPQEEDEQGLHSLRLKLEKTKPSKRQGTNHPA
jgi:hypothetical protein